MRLFNPANNNEPTEAWVEFYGTETFEWAIKVMPELVWKIKSNWLPGGDTEQSTANFIWFVKFEKSFKETEDAVKLVVV